MKSRSNQYSPVSGRREYGVYAFVKKFIAPSLLNKYVRPVVVRLENIPYIVATV